MKDFTNEDLPTMGKKFAHIPNSDAQREQAQRQKAISSREQLEWIRRQLEYAAYSEKFKTRYDLKKGEIYEFDFGINVNAEFSMRHYGVVMADSSIWNPLVIVCPLKTNHHGAHPRSDVDLGVIEDLCSENSTVAVVNQVRTLDKLRLFTKHAIGSLAEKEEGMKKSDVTTYKEGKILRLSPESMKRIMDLYFYILIKGDSDHTK